MTPEEKRIVTATLEWVRLKALGEHKITLPLPTPADVDHSSLLLRLLAGKEPFENPPPRAYSYPWYRLLEDEGEDGLHEFEIYFNGMKQVNICQGMWDIEAIWGDKIFIVRWPGSDYVFKLSRSTAHVTTLRDGKGVREPVPGWKMERYGSESITENTDS